MLITAGQTQSGSEYEDERNRDVLATLAFSIVTTTYGPALTR